MYCTHIVKLRQNTHLPIKVLLLRVDPPENATLYTESSPPYPVLTHYLLQYMGSK
jgi:hypothetical protein